MKRNDVFRRKYLRAVDIPPDATALTIRNCVEEQIGTQRERKAVLYFEEETRGLALNVTNWGVLEDLYGEDSEDWVGRGIELYVTEVEFAGELRPAIRLRAPQKHARRTREDEPRNDDDESIPF